MWSIGSYFPYPNNVFCLGICGAGRTLALLPCSQILSVVSCSGIVAGGSSCLGRLKSRKNLFCHLSDVTHPYFFNFIKISILI